MSSQPGPRGLPPRYEVATLCGEASRTGHLRRNLRSPLRTPARWKSPQRARGIPTESSPAPAVGPGNGVDLCCTPAAQFRQWRATGCPAVCTGWHSVGQRLSEWVEGTVAAARARLTASALSRAHRSDYCALKPTAAANRKPVRFKPDRRSSPSASFFTTPPSQDACASWPTSSGCGSSIRGRKGGSLSP